MDLHVTFSKKKYHFANKGGTTVVFEYNCQSNSWELISSENRGIKNTGLIGVTQKEI